MYLFAMAVQKKFTNMIICDGVKFYSWGEPFYKVEEESEIGSIGDNSVMGKPTFSNEIVKEDVQVLEKGIATQSLLRGLN